MIKQGSFILFLLLLSCFNSANAQLKYENDFVLNFLIYYQDKMNIKDSFVKDSNLFWSVSNSEVKDPYGTFCKIIFIHLKIKDSCDFWISCYFHREYYYPSFKFLYYNIGGQYEVDISEQDHMIWCIKKRLIEVANMGINTSFYNKRKRVIRAMKVDGQTKIRIFKFETY